MLLNEFLKEHKRVQEQQATIAELKSTVSRQQVSFQSKFAEQERQIQAAPSGLQKVSAQLAAASPSRGGIEISTSAPHVVANSR
jgi:hypothetical protein